MKILLVNAKPSLADALAVRPGVNVELLWPRRHDFACVRPPQFTPLQFYHGGNKLNSRAIWQLRKILRAAKPDIVHAFYGRALTHVVLASIGMNPCPQIVSFRGITSPLGRFDIGDWLSYRHPLVAAHACESDAVRQALDRSGVDPRICWTTYNSMYHVPTQRPGKAILAQFDIPTEAFVVGTMAAMRRVKGIDLLLEAAVNCADLKDIYWLLIGDVLDPSIFQLAADPRIRSRIRLTGRRKNASELISGADVFVMPSRAEALCQALLEAMYQGVCPIVSAAGGMKEVVRHGVDGLVVPTENVAALAQAIRALYVDRSLVTRLAMQAQQRITDEFTAERMADRTLSTYRHLLESPPSRRAA
jgi:glycosyltransferase involved in cell wall biosynthesis